MSDIELATIAPGGASLRLRVALAVKPTDASVNGGPPAIATVPATGLLLVIPDGTTVVEATFAAPIEFPRVLISEDGTRLRDGASLAGADAALRRSAAEVMRRLQRVELDASAAADTFLGVKSPFGTGSAFVGASLSLRLASVIAPGWQWDIAAELSAYADLDIAVAGVSVTRRVALTCVFASAAAATLRIEADDLNLRLPAFALAGFDLRAQPTWLLSLVGVIGDPQPVLPAWCAGAAVTVQHMNPNGEPRLLLQVAPGLSRIEWALVDSGAPMTLSTFDALITTGAAGYGISISGIRLADGAGFPTTFVGQVALHAASTIPIDPGTRRLGPLELAWTGARLELMATPTLDGLCGRLAFDRLVLRVQDDDASVLTFKGVVEVTPTGVRIVSLELLAPFPLSLVQAATGMVERAASGIVHLVVPFSNLAADQAARLHDILGRLAAAVGRATVFVGDAAGSAVDLIGQALAGVADSVAAALRKLDSLAPAAPSDLQIEIRLGTQPLELRQVLVSLPAPGKTDLEAVGLHLGITGSWRPGLLFDFVGLPGAYLTLVPPHPPVPGAALATLSTDLWLDRDDGTHATRDADPATGKRSEHKPLLGLELKLKPGASVERILVLVGISRGEAKFLQWLVGEAAPVTKTVGRGPVTVTTVAGPIALVPIASADFALTVDFQTGRILPLLGMGDTGETTPAAGGAPPGTDFLDKLRASLSTVVWVKESRTTADLTARTAGIDLVLGLKAGGLETELKLHAGLALDTLALSLAVDKSFPLVSRRIEERALGLVWIVEQKDPEARAADKPVPLFTMGFAGGQSGFELSSEARMQVRFDGLSSDARGVVFAVTTFKVSSAGLDLVAEVSDTPVRLNGLDVPFRFTGGRIEIRGGRLVTASIAGRGRLPPDLIGEADCSVALSFGEDAAEGIVLKSGKVELDKKNDPIVCHASRFTLTVSDLDLSFVKDGGYHFYYLVTGSLRFTPARGEFESGLLQFLDGVEMNLERTPLAADPRVLLKHISFQKTLNPKKSFNLFNLFSFELRGFGYHPAAPKFDGAPPAVNLSGQIRFVEIGDVMQPKIDFHGLWIAPPAAGQSLPRIKADGLGIDLDLKGSIRVRGSVLAVDPDTPTVEGRDFAPDGYKTYGFLGQGELEIPGFGNLSANLGFLELQRKERPGDRRKAFYFYAEKKRVEVRIPAGPTFLHAREYGFGAGFRYTLEALALADKAKSVPQLIGAMDEVSKRSGDLHQFSAWRPEPEGDRVTLALKGALQPYPPPSERWNESAERDAESPFFFDIVAAIRSDFTLFMGLRGWLGVNYHDYLNDADGLRSKPGLRGYLYISAPEKRLLARMIGDSEGYIGERVPALRKQGKEDPPLRRALRSVDWSATLFVKPGLFHYELGWPNQLVARLVDEPNLRITVRGGMIFRAAEDGLLWGYNLEAEASFRFGGSARAGSLGLSAEAALEARLVARLLGYLSWRLRGSLFYALISLDATLEIAVRAWMDVDLGFTSFTVKIGFSISIHFSAVVELAISTDGVGARVQARVAISIFGCTLGVELGFTVGGGALEDARARVQRFLAMSITAEQPDTAPAVIASDGDKRVEADADHARASVAATAQPVNASVPKPRRERSKFGEPGERGTDFSMVLHRAGIDPEGKPAPPGFAYALLVPCEPAVGRCGFYAPMTFLGTTTNPPERDPNAPVYLIDVPDGWGDVKRCDPGAPGRAVSVGPAGTQVEVKVGWTTTFKTDGKDLTLADLFDECFLTDTEWADADHRITTAWAEPRPRRHVASRTDRSRTDAQRVSDRDLGQRACAARALGHPEVEAVHAARSTALKFMLDQFVEMATKLPEPPDGRFHVTDVGLVFYGPADLLGRLTELVKIERFDRSHLQPTLSLGNVTYFNPPAVWFAVSDPELADDRQAVAPIGVQLDWRLVAFTGTHPCDPGPDPEHFLHHYEIRRTIEGREFTSAVTRVKPASTIGDDADAETVKLIRPEWQYVDALTDADVSPSMRRALLPPADEAAAFEAATAWVEIFARKDAISITYSVTPVDIAGTPGVPKSFLVKIARPSPPITPAEAELRIVVRTMSRQDAATGEAFTDIAAFDGTAAPAADTIGIAMALRDASFPRDAASIKGRRYRLYADPSDIAPSGHYGAGALLADASPSPLVFTPGADAIVWEIGAGTFRDVRDGRGRIPADTPLDAIEADPGVLATYPRWCKLAGTLRFADAADPMEVEHWLPEGKPQPTTMTAAPIDIDFLASLWRRLDEHGKPTGARIATRFGLQTVVSVERQGGTPLDLCSTIVPVAIELRIEPVVVTVTSAVSVSAPVMPRGETGLLRPPVFEWPVHLRMPRHAPGQVRAASGFACFRAPREDASLRSLLSGDANSAPVLIRDAERRVLTEVAFAAGLRADRQELLHSAIAAYDLHELDVDELAPLDTQGGAPFGSNATTWRRARRVARIERVTPAAARLRPDANHDWNGWQAHYPSETWRLLHRGEGSRPGASIPMRATWYSAAESTIGFARRVPRLRFFPTVPEHAVGQLLSKGRPSVVRARLDFEPKSPAYRTLSAIAATLPAPAGAGGAGVTPRAPTTVEAVLASGRLLLHPLRCAGGGDPATPIGSDLVSNGRGGGWTGFSRKSAFDASSLRGLLLRLGWGLDPNGVAHAWDGILQAQGDDSHAFDGLQVQLEGLTADNPPGSTGEITLPFPTSAFLHPLLDELLGELEYATQGPLLYRRYVVMPQTVQPNDAMDLAGFLASTAVEKDPYGWAMLQQLGLATTLRMHDRDTDRFLGSWEVAARLEPRLTDAARRYRRHAGCDSHAQPFVELLLKPGRDRLSTPFDAVVRESGVEPEASPLDLMNDALAMVQVSLRPVPVAACEYRVLRRDWAAGEWPTVSEPEAPQPQGLEVVETLRGYDIIFGKADRPYEVIRSTDGVRLRVEAGGTGSMPAIGFPRRWLDAPRPDAELVFFVRSSEGLEFVDADPISLEARISKTTTTATGPNLKKQEIAEVRMRVGELRVRPFTTPEGGLSCRDGELRVGVPVRSPAVGTGAVSPYERFGSLSAEDWVTIAIAKPPPGATRSPAGAAFESLRQNMRVTLNALQWPLHPESELDPSDYRDMPAYLAASQRFLDHAAGPGTKPPRLPWALAAPVKAQPWQLAADDDGWLRLSFLHADRWAHARAYAVRPTPRYESLALGAGYRGEPRRSEQLIDDTEGETLADALGYALAVSPRTERIEPPVILDSRLARKNAEDIREDASIWELVVARHGEEALAMSNRPLFARLGTEGTALSFVREYRDPEWPERLQATYPGVLPKAVELYPVRQATPPSTPAEPSGAADALNGWAQRLPSLWKGADVWRIDDLPPHYRVTALAVARAGIVVSKVVATVQDATPRQALKGRDGHEVLGTPEVAIVQRKLGFDLWIEGLRLISHADLHTEAAKGWLNAADRNDVAWWPDPNVAYTLLRMSGSEPKPIVDEDATVRLVAAPAADAENVPIIVRTRGTRFGAMTRQGTALAAEAEPPGFVFHFGLRPTTATNRNARRTLRFADGRLRDVSRGAFNTAADGFATIRARTRFELAGVGPLPDALEEARARLQQQAVRLATAATHLTGGTSAQATIATALDKLANQLNIDGAMLSANYEPHHWDTLTCDLDFFDLLPSSTDIAAVQQALDASSAPPIEVVSRYIEDVLTLTSLPHDQLEAENVRNTFHPLADYAGPLWPLCREWLLGGAHRLAIRAVDGRNAIARRKDRTTETWDAVGETEVDIGWPEWVDWGAST